MKRLLPLILFLIALSWMVGACSKPAAAPLSPASAITVVEYEALLSDCRNAGKESHSFDLYKLCADQVDAKLCAEKHVRCGGAK